MVFPETFSKFDTHPSKFHSQSMEIQHSKTPYIKGTTNVVYSQSSKVQLQKITSIEDFCEYFGEVETIIDEIPIQGLTELFPGLLAVIFGYGGHPGWKLKYTDRRNCLPQVYERILIFMHPNGKLFKLIERLLVETTVKFHFPVDCLPGQSQNCPNKSLATVTEDLNHEKAKLDLNKGIVSPFYQERLPVTLSGQLPSQLELNALEYYLFLFAYYIVRPTSSKDKSQWSRYGDNLYQTIFEYYLNYFLPSDGSEIQVLSPSSITGKEMLHSRIGAHFSNYNRPNFGTEALGFRPGTNILVPSLSADTTRRETWRSEVFIQILCEFWLSHHSPGSPLSFSRLSREYNIPSEDQVRTVRMLVKHVHAFANSGKTTVQSLTQFCGASENHTEELKRCVIPMFIQRGLYNFLKYTFSQWPLDPSFKLVLETWLSFIQPWRYTAGSYHETSEPQRSDLNIWKNFVTESILFYTTFVRLFLPRALRFDLRSTGDSHQLFRVLKVLGQANLIEIIEEVDHQVVTSSGTTSVHSLSASHQSSVSYLGLHKAAHHVELEDPRYVYKSFFDDQVTFQSKELAQRLSETISTLQREEIRKKRERYRKRNEGIFGRMKSFFGNDQERDEGHEEKLMEYLNRSYATLVSIFKLPMPTVIADPIPDDEDGPTNGLPRPRLFSETSDDGEDHPDCRVTDQGLVLTQKGRLQVINGLKRLDVCYQGDDELQPIRSYEIPFLVRSLFSLSCTFNEKYGDELRSLYRRQDPIGSVLRGLAIKSIGHSVQKTQELPADLHPRVSLRFLSSHYTLGYFIWIILLLRLLGVGFIGIVVVSLLLLFFALAKNIRLIEAKSKRQ